MSDVFLSYKRADEVRVGRLVQALAKAGVPVWWDRGLPGGEPWRSGIDAALTQARCVVVVWSRQSVGEQGGFVKDEAGRAAKRRILVPVLLDEVEPPLGFGEIQAINLTRWRGSVRDPFFLDLVAAIAAKVEGRGVPAPLGPLRRLRRRMTTGAVLTALLAFGAAWATNTLNLQNRSCGMPAGQPWITDACGALGLGGRPTRAERLAWAERPPGDCAALRQHLRLYPDGAYQSRAKSMLDARSVSFTEQWRPMHTPAPLRLVVGSDGAAAATEPAARAFALERGRAKAAMMCRDIDASGLTRFRRADVDAQEWSCSAVRGGHACGFEGRALCLQDGLSKTEIERCDGKPSAG